MEKTTIRVLPHHITDSEVGQPRACMVYDAIVEGMFPDASETPDVSVGGSSITFGGGPYVVLDESVARKITNFDRKGRVKPFEFDIEPNPKEKGFWKSSPARNLDMPAVQNKKETE